MSKLCETCLGSGEVIIMASCRIRPSCESDADIDLMPCMDCFATGYIEDDEK